MSDLTEQLSALEHEQWAHWTKYMLDNISPTNIVRWRKQIEIPYSELTEKEKQSDRNWAVKSLTVVADAVKEDMWVLPDVLAQEVVTQYLDELRPPGRKALVLMASERMSRKIVEMLRRQAEGKEGE